MAPAPSALPPGCASHLYFMCKNCIFYTLDNAGRQERERERETEKERDIWGLLNIIALTYFDLNMTNNSYPNFLAFPRKKDV